MLGTWVLLEADALDALLGMPAASADALLSDVPYGLLFGAPKPKETP